MYLSNRASGIRQREAQNARSNRAEIIQALSIGQISRRDLFRWGIFTTSGLLVCKNGLSPFAPSAFAQVPTGTPRSPLFNAQKRRHRTLVRDARVHYNLQRGRHRDWIRPAPIQRFPARALAQRNDPRLPLGSASPVPSFNANQTPSRVKPHQCAAGGSQMYRAPPHHGASASAPPQT
jgi:hypothetical protein